MVLYFELESSCNVLFLFMVLVFVSGSVCMVENSAFVLYPRFHNSWCPWVDFTKSRKSKINRKCCRTCDFQAFDWLKFTLTTDLI